MPARQPRRAGQPTKLTEGTVTHIDGLNEIQVTDWTGPAKKMLDLVGMGSHVSIAARAAGITRETWYEWQRRGNAARAAQTAGTRLTTAEDRYARFSDAVEEAEARAEAFILGQIVAEVRRRPEVGLRLLAQRHPDRWAPQTNIELSGPGKGPIEHQLDSLEALDAKLAQIAERKARPLPQPSGMAVIDVEPVHPNGADPSDVDLVDVLIVGDDSPLADDGEACDECGYLDCVCVD